MTAECCVDVETTTGVDGHTREVMKVYVPVPDAVLEDALDETEVYLQKREESDTFGLDDDRKPFNVLIDNLNDRLDTVYMRDGTPLDAEDVPEKGSDAR
jgi:hypothetical protein